MKDALSFDLNKKYGEFRVLNATNGGPWHKRHATDQFRSNFEDYKAANLKYSRNHDSAIHTIYGGPYSHDITYIFPNFDADPLDPESYDFACTDESVLTTLEAGVETFFRLGQTIEHQIKKHGTLPPRDFEKWAVICEHIIRHYNEGWANGYKLGIKYWEIWNEPDLDTDDSDNKRTWGGTKAQFFDLYEIASKHLKACFPDLKIGGPALAFRLDWADDFLCEMKKRKVEIDFFSWHIYATEPSEISEKAEKIKHLLVKHGYENAESILNEWNYVKGWVEEYKYSIQTIHGIKGAAFVMATISAAELSSIDMMMYYDTRPSIFCGAFDYYTYEPLPTYYALKWYGELYGAEVVRANGGIDNIYSLCGVKNGKTVSIITYYSDKDGLPDKTVSLDFGKDAKYEMYLVDAEHNGELVDKVDGKEIVMKQNTFVMLKEI